MMTVNVKSCTIHKDVLSLFLVTASNTTVGPLV